jgi:hypothetical protein
MEMPSKTRRKPWGKMRHEKTLRKIKGENPKEKQDKEKTLRQLQREYH